MENIKVSIKNIGPLKEAEFEVSDLTIICGENNTGKTYAAYAFYGYLNDIYKQSNLIPDNFISEIAGQLCTTSSYQMSIFDFQKYSSEYFKSTAESYLRIIHTIFSSSRKKFNKSHFLIKNEVDSIHNFSDINYRTNLISETDQSHILKINNSKNNDHLEFRILPKVKTKSADLQEQLEFDIQEILQNEVHKIFLPNSFLTSSERTGTTIFQRVVDVTQDRLINFMKREKKVPIQKFLKEFTGSYTAPVKSNIDFVRIAYETSQQKSYILNKYPKIYNEFRNILSGDYFVDSLLGIRFVPTWSTGENFSLEESSSTARALVHLGLYLKHLAKEGDLLIIDEPELNLHPNNQRKLARLLARLVNVGIRVFITTHSDYILREFNTLILLNQKDKPVLKEFMENEKYSENELLNADDIRAYSTEKVDSGNGKESHLYKLKPTKVEAGYGIEAKSFNPTFDEMNRIQEEIYWLTDDE